MNGLELRPIVAQIIQIFVYLENSAYQVVVDGMDYSSVLAEVNKASLFDLYRLMVAVNQQLDNPERIEEIKLRLKPGQEITYFDEQENRLIEAMVISLQRTHLLVQNIRDGERWSIRFCTVNLDQAQTDIQAISVRNGPQICYGFSDARL